MVGGGWWVVGGGWWVRSRPRVRSMTPHPTLPRHTAPPHPTQPRHTAPPHHAHQIDVLWVCTVSAPVSQWAEASPFALGVIDAFRVDSD